MNVFLILIAVTFNAGGTGQHRVVPKILEIKSLVKCEQLLAELNKFPVPKGKAFLARCVGEV